MRIISPQVRKRVFISFIEKGEYEKSSTIIIRLLHHQPSVNLFFAMNEKSIKTHLISIKLFYSTQQKHFARVSTFLLSSFKRRKKKHSNKKKRKNIEENNVQRQTCRA